MVDLSTAMSAAQGSGGRGGKSERPKSLPAHKALEPFDPVKHAAKEKADTVSMWIVLSFATIVALLERFLLMPSMGPGEAEILWIGPILLAFALPSLHRSILPEIFTEHYTKGTWFRATFLHIFTWLAISFLMVNPPFGDISAPGMPDGDGVDGWAIAKINTTGEVVQLEGLDISRSGATIEISNITLSENERLIMLVGIRDNSDAQLVSVNASIRTVDGELFLEALDEAALENATSTPFLRTMTMSDSQIETMQGFEIPHIGIGAYDISITFTDQGEPWINSATVELAFNVDAGNQAS